MWHMFKPINDRDRLAMDEAKIGKVSWSLKAATEENQSSFTQMQWTLAAIFLAVIAVLVVILLMAQPLLLITQTSQPPSPIKGANT